MCTCDTYIGGMIRGDDIGYDINRSNQSPRGSGNNSVHICCVGCSDYQSTGSRVQARRLNPRFCLTAQVIDVT